MVTGLNTGKILIRIELEMHRFPRARYSSQAIRKVLSVLLVILMIEVSLACVITHDNPVGLTRIADIKAGKIPVGANVTVKGKITQVIVWPMSLNSQSVTISDGRNNITFSWSRSIVHHGWSIFVRGTVHSGHRLTNVISVERVWLFP